MSKKLRVWWIPQIPMQPFYVEVSNVAEGVKIMEVLSEYDKFQFENNVKPDYCNAGGLEMFTDDCGEDNQGWEDWYDDETGEDDPEEWLKQTALS